MINKNLNLKFYLVVIAFLLFTGCGGGGSGANGEESSNILSSNVLYPTKAEILEVTSTENNILNSIPVNAQDLLDALNRERAGQHSCGSYGTFGPVHPLVWDSKLHLAALEHATDLAISNTFSHDGSGTASDITGNIVGHASKFYERITYNGYLNYHTVGENIAGGQQTLDEVMKAWMASPGHCANIMKANYTEVGIAIVKRSNSTYGIYWTQSFGSQRR